jgi:hypothetical protein
MKPPSVPVFPASPAASRHDWVDAAPFRAHLRHLVDTAAATPEAVAVLAGIAPRVPRRLLTGDGGRPMRRLSSETARRLLAVTPAVLLECRRRLVPAGPVRASLTSSTWSTADWSDVLGLPANTVDDLRRGRADTCTLWTWVCVRAAATAGRAAQRTTAEVATPAARPMRLALRAAA